MTSLALQSTLAFVYRCLGAGVTFGFSIVLARWMQIDDYGIFASLMSLTLVVATVGLAGQQMVLLRRLPTLLHDARHAEVLSTSSRSLALAAIVTAVLTAGGGIALLTGASQTTADPWAFWAALALLFPLVLVELQSAIGRALGSINSAILPKDLLWRLVIILCAGLAHWQLGAPLPAWLVLSIAAAVLFTIALGQLLFLVRLNERRPLFSARGLGGTKVLVGGVRDSFAFWATSVANILFVTLDVVCITAIVGPAAGGYYYAANRLALLLDFFLSAFAIPAAATIARLHDEKRKADITVVASGAALLSCLLAALGLAVLVLAGRQILTLFGGAFDRSFAPMIVLGAGQVVSAYLGVGVIALNMTGHQGTALKIMLSTSTIALPTMIVSSWLFGVIGGAAVAAAWIVAMKGWMALHLWQAEGIDSTGTACLASSVHRLWNERRRLWVGVVSKGPGIASRLLRR